ncbi:hypothetical protein KDN34_15440 [Shewanella yunxiaonensis]|uniref:Lipoprotein n=1 Tax=Shewanella yunxiaonensis TaxID=2829809 RepID=A0ABX7YTW3_9GAMM|nr:hypothetical protein [Shewanella yunxiaonensis]QUN05561.1 hypothetical protein KDN34_15440 [Shewanella yunxiaonensis]
MKKLAILIMTVLLSGCVGVATMYNPETNHEDLKFKLMGRGVLFDYKEKNHNYSKSDVVAAWGQPDSKCTSSDLI